MRRPARQRETSVVFGLLLCFLEATGVSAAQPTLSAKCQEPEKAGAAATVSCDVRVNGLVVIEGVKAAIKGVGDLEATFEKFDSAEKGVTTAYMVQILPTSRRTTLAQMGDAVVTFTDQREGKRRFTAYTFGNDLNLVSDSGASRNEFARQLIAIKPASTTVQLYKTALQAVEALAKEAGERKALVILGDGTTDDTGYSHDQVVKAAKDAGIVIHVLGYYDDRSARPEFQKLSRLAEDTGGFATEVKQGPGKDRDFTKDIVNNRFTSELLENGGTVKATLKGPAGDQTLELTADLAEGQDLKAEAKVNVPAAAAPPSFDQQFSGRREEPEPPPASAMDELLGWAEDNMFLVGVLGALLALGAAGAVVYGRQYLAKVEAEPAATEYEPVDEDMDDGGGEGELLLDAAGQPVVYGWLEMMDGNASRHPLRTTNVRVGRHRDNDICLQNDSISRRHAVLHYNAETRRFVITDLGGGNGVIVNKTKYKSRELNDGDMVELGEVRLRFRAETEYLA
jgi:hypothetical protein